MTTPLFQNLYTSNTLSRARTGGLYKSDLVASLSFVVMSPWFKGNWRYQQVGAPGIVALFYQT